jgi:hypothetical protein
MIFLVGLCPSRKAGSATEEQIDLRFRGGMLMIKRVVAPLATFWRAWLTASVDQIPRECDPRIDDREDLLNETAEIVSQIHA